MIEVADLVKEYGPIRALDGVSFSVRQGDVVGFLGPNGAGKTTCMKIITGFLAATSGTVMVDGRDVVQDGVAVRSRIGYLPENAPLYTDMSGREYLRFVATVRGIADKDVAARIDAVAKTVGVGHVLDQEIGTLSKGYRQRVGLAQAMIHDPEILILDEPTSGLDPNQIVEIRQLIKELGQDRTVILSTHNLHEVTASCNRIIVIHRGRIAADGTPDQIQAAHGGGNSFLLTARTGDVSSLGSALSRIPGASGVTPLESGETGAVAFCIEAARDIDLRAAVFDACVAHQSTILELRRERLDLESIFQRITMQ